MFTYNLHCVKSISIRSYSGPCFPAFKLNTEKYSLFLHIQFERRKIRTKKTWHAVTFYPVLGEFVLHFYRSSKVELVAELRLYFVKIAAYIDTLITLAYLFDIIKNVWKCVKHLVNLGFVVLSEI